MKVRRKDSACSIYSDDVHAWFEIIEYCCPKSKEHLPQEKQQDSIIYYYMNDDDTLCWGSFGEYLIDDVKFCPWCGNKVVVEDG